MLTYQDLINKISELAVEAQNVMEEQSAARIEDLFDKDDDDVFQPKMVKINLFGNEIEVPKIVLRNMNSLKIDEMRMDLETDVDLSDAGDVSVTLKKGGSKTAAHTKIEVTFKAIDAPEGMALIQDRMNTTISEITGGLNNGGIRTEGSEVRNNDG